MTRCLVTGGCGFIGSAVVKKLVQEGWKVDVVDDLSGGDISFLDGVNRRTVHVDILPLFEYQHEKNRTDDLTLVMTGDFSHEHVLSRIRDKKYDYVFHLAARPRVAYSVKDPVTTMEHNLFKTTALFYACVGCVKRVIFSSSSSVFGKVTSFPTDEEHPKSPCSPYALQKYACEQFASLFVSLYDVDIVGLRYFNVYGPGQLGDSPYSTVVSAWCHAATNNLKFRLDGDGTQSRDFTYVDDVVEANLLAALAPSDVQGNMFNIGYGSSHSLNDILDEFKTRYEDIEVRNTPSRAGDVHKTHANIGKASSLLGYHPKTELFEGLKNTFEWWDSKEKTQ